ncbi:MAG: hypothetical protein EU551_04675 [Promethearchaeota archaeon]|nr:MAG: hypothetical protein EU551_04675 [Candidatus Lokiarchaeota archaeon]
MKTKSIIVLTLILVSTIAMPTMVAGYGTDTQTNEINFDDLEISQDGIGDMIGGLFGGFGSILGGGGGAAGQLLGQVFMMLFTDMYSNFSMNEMMSGVYVFSATTTDNSTGNSRTLSGNATHYLPYSYYNDLGIDPANQTVYCNVSTEGQVSIDYEAGVGITLIIWDNDKSFVNTLMRIINFVKSLDLENGNITRDQIIQGLQLISWFFIHINEIINGDELFVLNPITWQKIKITPIGGVDVETNWLRTGIDKRINSDDVYLNDTQVGVLHSSANSNKDAYMQFLTINQTTVNNPQFWTEFTFDLFQLWVKNFHINIDLGEIGNLIGNLGSGSGGSNPSLGDIFKGLDVEFFLFTHHLAGTFLYDDRDDNDNLSIEYVNLTDSNGDPIKTSNNRTIQVPQSTEITNRVHLRNATDFKYLSPSREDNSIKWGINVTDVNVSTIPVGIGLDALTQTDNYELDNLYLGFTFEPETSPYGYINAPVKLDQHFGKWTNSTGGTDLPNIEGLDLAVMYISTGLHFHLQGNVSEVEENYMTSASKDFKDGNKSLSIGNYISGDIEDKLEFVDIAGPGYNMSGGFYQANTSVIPLGLWESEMERRDTFNQTSYSSSQVYVSEISLEIDFQVMAYAVCYPEFDGSGAAIIHDPTFNVFMIFPGAPTFEAVILLSALIAPFGIATVIITLLKRRRII